MSAPRVPSSRGASSTRSAHIRQVDAEFARQLGQDAARDEGHDDHEEDLEGVPPGVGPQAVQQLAELVVEVLDVAVAGGALVARGRGVVTRRGRVRGAGVGAGVAGAGGRVVPGGG